MIHYYFCYFFVGYQWLNLKCMFFSEKSLSLWKNLKFSPPLIFSWNGPKILLYQPFPLLQPPPLNPEMEGCAHMPNNTKVHCCWLHAVCPSGSNFCQSLNSDLFYKLCLKFVLMGHLATNNVFLIPWHPLYSFLSSNITIRTFRKDMLYYLMFRELNQNTNERPAFWKIEAHQRTHTSLKYVQPNLISGINAHYEFGDLMLTLSRIKWISMVTFWSSIKLTFWYLH